MHLCSDSRVASACHVGIPWVTDDDALRLSVRPSSIDSMPYSTVQLLHSRLHLLQPRGGVVCTDRVDLQALKDLFVLVRGRESRLNFRPSRHERLIHHPQSISEAEYAV